MECLEENEFFDGITSTFETSDSYSSSDERSDDEIEEDFQEGNITCMEQQAMQTVFPSLDPFKYVSPTFYSFDAKSYDLMKSAIKDSSSMTLEALKEGDIQGILDLKRWRKMRDKLCLKSSTDGSSYLCLNFPPNLKISYIEEWESIVKECHIKDGTIHSDIHDTIEKIKSIWSVDIRRQGIPIAYVRDLLNACECARWNKECNTFVSNGGKNNVVLLQHYKTIEVSQLHQTLTTIMVEYKVRLVMVRSKQNAGKSKYKVIYACHRGRQPRRRETPKRLRRSKRCGCPFQVAVQICHVTEQASIDWYPVHEGHLPGTRGDLYHLPIHPTVIECCMEDLFDVGCARHVAKMSLSKETLHFERSSPVHQLTYRFFMIQREISMMAYQIRSQGNIYIYVKLFYTIFFFA